MTEAEAKLLFNQLEDSDDIADFYEEQLFEFKQFFLSKAPIAKLFEGRLTKLKKFITAYKILAKEEKNNSETEISTTFFVADEKSILKTYLAFQKEKNELKRLISNSEDGLTLLNVAKALLILEKQNAEIWQSTSLEEDIIVSKEPDPMYLLEAIKKYQQQNGESFEQLKNLQNNPPELLIQEMKRLSLLYKKF